MGDQLRQQNIFVQPVRLLRDRTVIDAMVATTGWAVLGNDTLNLATDDDSILGNKSLSFDKVDGAADTVVAGIEKTLSSVLDLSEFLANDLLTSAVFLSDLTNVASVSIRFGTDSSNYSVFTVADSALTVSVWNPLSLALSSADVANQVGTGHDLAAIAYVAVLVTFDAEADALANILWDHLIMQAVDN